MINPKVIDARTEITTELLSEKGYFFKMMEMMLKKHLNKKIMKRIFFVKKQDIIFCETFLSTCYARPTPMR